MTTSPIYETKEFKTMAARAMRQVNEDLYKQHRAGIFDEGDPNHPKYNNGINYTTGLPATIFGYETRQFMARQYAKGRAP